MSAADRLLAGLDPEQIEAATCLSGPLLIIAGAGTGKTRTVTHRIAYGVVTGHVPANQVLAVTHSTKAAGELRARLGPLGVRDVAARTFHAAALRQLKYFWPKVGRDHELELMSNPFGMVARVAERVLGQRLQTDEIADLIAEIEWARARRLTAGEYAAAARAAGRQTPVDADRAAPVLSEYKLAKEKAGVVDFSDLLELMSGLIETDAEVAAQVRAAYRWFTVDEYQDVDAAQVRLLDAWLGDSHEVCAVGDPRQTIYSFKGADPSLLAAFPRRHGGTRTVELSRDYRSTPQVVDVANKVLTRGAPLRSESAEGPKPAVLAFRDEQDEEEAIVTRITGHLADGVPASEIAVLLRINAQSARFEAAFAAAGIRYQVTDTGAFHERPEIRAVVEALRGAERRDPETPAGDALDAALSSVGWDAATPPPGVGAARERWESVSAFVDLVREVATESVGDLLADIARQADEAAVPAREAVTIATLHRAKGLEWDVVFIPRIVEGLLPISYARTDDAQAEERRLFYVGITRARTHLALSWAQLRADGRKSRRSRMLQSVEPTGAPGTKTARVRTPGVPAAEKLADGTYGGCSTCGKALKAPASGRMGKCPDCMDSPAAETWERLREWRLEKARADAVPAYVVLDDKTLLAIAESQPGTKTELARIPGLGPVKLDRYGEEVLALVSG